MWPARGVAEHAYCPQMFYYMTVEGVFIPNSDTEEGAGAHRRVDRPSAATPEPAITEKRTRGRAAADKTEKLEEVESDPDRPRSIRSLALTSERLGLTATLDLTEIEGTTAVPVEYRKGEGHSTMPGRRSRPGVVTTMKNDPTAPWAT